MCDLVSLSLSALHFNLAEVTPENLQGWLPGPLVPQKCVLPFNLFFNAQRQNKGPQLAGMVIEVTVGIRWGPSVGHSVNLWHL